MPWTGGLFVKHIHSRDGDVIQADYSQVLIAFAGWAWWHHIVESVDVTYALEG